MRLLLVFSVNRPARKNIRPRFFGKNIGHLRNITVARFESVARRACLGSYNVHAAECFVLLAGTVGAVQPTHRVSPQRHRFLVARRQRPTQDDLFLSTLRQPQHQPAPLLLHRTEIPTRTQGELHSQFPPTSI